MKFNLLASAAVAALVGPISDPAHGVNGLAPPTAIRYWGNGTISIESYWLPQVVIGPAETLTSTALRDRMPDFGLMVPTTPLGDSGSGEAEHDHPNPRPFALDMFEPGGEPRKIQQRYDRLPNQLRATLQSALNRMATSGHELTVINVAGMPPAEGGDPSSIFPLLITVDSLKIVYWGNRNGRSLAGELPSYATDCDVLLLPLPPRAEPSKSAELGRLIEQLRPRILIPLMQGSTSKKAESKARFHVAATAPVEVLRQRGNTLAVADAIERGQSTVKLALLEDRPWQPSSELAGLLERMDAACRDSQAVFVPLSIKQMNFQPSNGSHTPRWNVEHMMGRQLHFFTEIYAVLDPAFKPIDLNPEQMPTDYEAAHANWTGAEEAGQMQRANALVQRFAYLLDGVPLDQRAPGSRWTLRGLLEQMERHFGEHTANVQKKFELPDWPEE